jgi:hypothetical protein
MDGTNQMWEINQALKHTFADSPCPLPIYLKKHITRGAPSPVAGCAGDSETATLLFMRRQPPVCMESLWADWRLSLAKLCAPNAAGK